MDDPIGENYHNSSYAPSSAFILFRLECGAPQFRW